MLALAEKHSAARSALRTKIEQAEAAGETVNAARVPYDQARDQVEHAQALARDAQTALQDHDSKEAAAIAETWSSQSLSPQERKARRELEDNLSHAVRVLRSVEAKAEAARKEYDSAVLAAQSVAAEIDSAVVAVIVEEGEAAIARLTALREKGVKAEQAVRSLMAALAGSGHFVEGEKLNAKFLSMGRLEGVINPTPFIDLMAKLRANAAAEVAS